MLSLFWVTNARVDSCVVSLLFPRFFAVPEVRALLRVPWLSSRVFPALLFPLRDSAARVLPDLVLLPVGRLLSFPDLVLAFICSAPSAAGQQ